MARLLSATLRRARQRGDGMYRLNVLLTCGFFLLLPITTQAQDIVAAPNADLRFDFATPGARSLALGGAFVGLGDDATSAFVNPAGLRSISRTEVSVEGRFRAFGIPVNFGSGQNVFEDVFNQNARPGLTF